MIIDAHMHMDSATTPEILKQQGITCIVNAATPKEYSKLKKLQAIVLCPTRELAIRRYGSVPVSIHGRRIQSHGMRCCQC